MTKAVISALVRPLIEGVIPEGMQVVWIGSAEEALREVVDADIAWVDMHDKQAMRDIIAAGADFLETNTFNGTRIAQAGAFWCHRARRRLLPAARASSRRRRLSTRGPSFLRRLRLGGVHV